MNCAFKIGDRVKHKASGEIGIVVAINSSCNKHTSLEHLTMSMARLNRTSHPYKKCVMEYDGTINIDIGFNNDVITIDEFIVVHV